jgi:hypothetical protein
MYASKGFTMGPHIDAFCGDICLKLVDIDEELRYLKITIREKARHAEPQVRSQLEKVMKRMLATNPRSLLPGRKWNIGSRTGGRMLCFRTKKSPKTESEN